MTSARRGGLVVAAVGLAVRLAVVAWAAGTIPAAADGTYYDTLAVRLAEGRATRGSGRTARSPTPRTTRWGIPRWSRWGTRCSGRSPSSPWSSTRSSALRPASAWSLVARASSPRLALAAGLAVALHPALVPYTAALMTEGVTTSLLVVAAAVAAHARDAPQAASMARAHGARDGRRHARPPAVARAGAGARVARDGTPWPPGGGRHGAFERVRGAASARCGRRGRRLAHDPGGLRAVDRAQLHADGAMRARQRQRRMEPGDRRADRHRRLARARRAGGLQERLPGSRQGRVLRPRGEEGASSGTPARGSRGRPAKLRVTFDYFGAAPWYLHTANAERFPYSAKVALGAIETLASRLLLAAALVTLFRMRVPGASPVQRTASRVRKALAVVGLVACVLVPGTVGYLALAAAILALGWRALDRAPLVVPAHGRGHPRDGADPRRVLRRGPLRDRRRAVRRGPRVRASRERGPDARGLTVERKVDRTRGGGLRRREPRTFGAARLPARRRARPEMTRRWSWLLHRGRVGPMLRPSTPYRRSPVAGRSRKRAAP